MKTTFEAVDIIWSRLNELVSDQVSGGVYKYRRPFNSTNEDVVIGALPMSQDIPQTCSINVNCYVPNIKAKIKNVPNNDLPDALRLSNLAAFIISALTNVTDDRCYYYISNQAMLSNEAGNEHYVNIRLEFYFTDI